MSRGESSKETRPQSRIQIYDRRAVGECVVLLRELARHTRLGGRGAFGNLSSAVTRRAGKLIELTYSIDPRAAGFNHYLDHHKVDQAPKADQRPGYYWHDLKLSASQAEHDLAHRVDEIRRFVVPLTVRFGSVPPSTSQELDRLADELEQYQNATLDEQDKHGEEAYGKKRTKRKGDRVPRETYYPEILRCLTRNPRMTAEEVVDVVGCSKGVVVGCPYWKENQGRLKAVKSTGRDPIAVPLVDFINAGGANANTQAHEHRLHQESIDDQIDQRDKELNDRIEEIRERNPNATPRQIAKEVGCTVREVEIREAQIHALIAQQQKDQQEAHQPNKPAWRQKP